MKYWVHWNIIVEYEEIYSIMQSQFCIYSFPMSLIRIYVVKFCAGLQVSLYEDIFWNNALFMCATVEKVNLILKLPKYINYFFFSSLSQDEKHKHELYNFVHRIQTQSNWTSYMDFPDLRCFLLHLSKMRKINKHFFQIIPWQSSMIECHPPDMTGKHDLFQVQHIKSQDFSEVASIQTMLCSVAVWTVN